MQNSSDKSQQKQDDSRMNEEDDSLMMTIEYLRARLLSERSISKAAKERADDLVKKVKDLEEQLKVVTFQRKKAEKAALDVFSYLDSLGISDNLEVYECDSEDDESVCKLNMENSDMAREDKNFESSENKGNDKESSGSEQESTTPSSGRSLSWKGRKESTQHLDMKALSSSSRSRGGLAHLHSIPRHRLGKSCRQNRRRELRSTEVELTHGSGKCDTQYKISMEDSSHCQDCLNFRNGKLKRSPERYSERTSKKGEVSRSFQAGEQECDAGKFTRERECTGEMERALQHQAQLIRSFEVQEKAQRDWEEKFRDNNDSCEPGSHSDVTEERDENKAVVPHPIEADACHGDNSKSGMETNSREEKRSMAQFNSFKISPDAVTGCSGENRFREEPSASADFAFCVADDYKSLEHVSHSDSPRNLSTTQTLMLHKGPAKLGSVLEALQEAKQVIKQHMNSLSETRGSVGEVIATADPINRDYDWLKLPARCPGLFRVPTEHDGHVSNRSRFLTLNNPSEPTISTPINARSDGHFHVSKSLISTPKFTSELEISNGQPGSDFFPRRSSNQTMRQFQGNEAGNPPFGYSSYQNY